MKVNINKFKEDFSLKPFGAKSWFNSKSLDCPFCGKGYDKFGIFFSETGGGGSFHCLRCEEKGSLYKLLKKIERLDLVLDRESEDFSYKDKLDSFLKLSSIQEVDFKTEEITLPLGFSPIKYDEYLEDRGWLPSQYSQFNVGLSSIDPRFRDKILFLIKEDDRLVGYLSRSKKSKAWHKENLKQAKLDLEKLVLRYDNSRKTNFEKLVGGLDEIIEGVTKTVIMVEGIFDKANVDRVLGLNDTDDVKCVFNFGCHLSDIQMYKLLQKGVENIILMFDAGFIKQTKNVSLRMLRFFNIFITEIVEDKDPGEMNLFEFESCFQNLKTPIDYFVNRVEIEQLK